VLTSNDPEYRAKVEAISKILSELRPDEAFFSVDEYGPFAIKMKGGKKRVGPGEHYVVPQWQKSKGWMILTAALELSRNQVTHFYSRKKNTGEMIKMADTLRDQYRSCKTLYLSWDAASWHISKDLVAHLVKLIFRRPKRTLYGISQEGRGQNLGERAPSVRLCGRTELQRSYVSVQPLRGTAIRATYGEPTCCKLSS